MSTLMTRLPVGPAVLGATLLMACGSTQAGSEGPPSSGELSGQNTASALPAPDILPALEYACIPQSELPPDDPATGSRGFVSGGPSVRVRASPVAVGEAPAFSVPMGEERVYCRVEYAPTCTDAEPGRAMMLIASREMHLGVLRDEGGVLRHIAWYRTAVHGMGPSRPGRFGSSQSERCRETVEWLWLGTDGGAVLISSPRVGWHDDACEAELETRVEGGLYCLVTTSETCGEVATPACYRLEGQRLVQTEAAPTPIEDPPAHPWRDESALPYPNAEHIRTAIRGTRERIRSCVSNGNQVHLRLLFDGSGGPELRELDSDAPLSQEAERCVREVVDTMVPPRFQGRVVTTAHLP